MLNLYMSPTADTVNLHVSLSSHGPMQFADVHHIHTYPAFTAFDQYADNPRKQLCVYDRAV